MAKSADAFRTISEVAEWLDTPAHVLRFWESKFSQVKPVKRAGGRRYYRPQDMMLLGGIKKLLHDDGMTIKSVQKLLRQEGVKHVAAFSADPSVSGSYALEGGPTAPTEPDTEVSRVVSFKAAPETAAAEVVEDTPEPEPEPADPHEEATLPFPSFLSGQSSMPAAEAPEPDEAPEEAVAEDPAVEETPVEKPAVEDAAIEVAAEEPAPLEDAPSPDTDTGAKIAPEEPSPDYPPIDIMAKLATMSVADVQAREAEIRPIMDRIRAELDRTA